MEQDSSMPVSMGKLQGIGDLLKEAKEIVMKRKAFFLPIAFIPALFHYVSGVLSENLALMPFAGLVTLVGVIVSLFATIAIINGLADEKMVDWKEAYKKSTSQFGSFVFVAFLVFLVTIIAFVLVIIPGIYVTIVLLFATFFNILEGKKGWKAAEASKELAKGYWWALFGRFIVYLLAVFLYGFVIGFVFGLVGGENALITDLGSLIVSTTVTPFALAYTYLLYKRLKELKRSN